MTLCIRHCTTTIQPASTVTIGFLEIGIQKERYCWGRALYCCKSIITAIVSLSIRSNVLNKIAHCFWLAITWFKHPQSIHDQQFNSHWTWKVMKSFCCWSVAYDERKRIPFIVQLITTLIAINSVLRRIAEREAAAIQEHRLRLTWDNDFDLYFSPASNSTYLYCTWFPLEPASQPASHPFIEWWDEPYIRWIRCLVAVSVNYNVTTRPQVRRSRRGDTKRCDAAEWRKKTRRWWWWWWFNIIIRAQVQLPDAIQTAQTFVHFIYTLTI